MLQTSFSLSLIWNLYYLSFFLFFTGLYALFLQQKSLILILMAFELALLGLGLFFILTSIYTGTVIGQLAIFILLTLGGAESAIGLTLLMLFFKLKSNVALLNISDLKA
jgi:NADH:ubiquinone oxidoreductase subunit K